MYYLYVDEKGKPIVCLFPLNMKLIFSTDSYEQLKEYMEKHNIEQH